MSEKNKIRENYPSLSVVILDFIHKTVYQAGIIGVVITLAIYPYYINFISYLRSISLNDQLIFTICMFLSHTGTFIIVAGFYVYCDYYQLDQDHKFPRKQSQIPKKPLIIKTIIEMAINHLITSPLMAFFMYSVFKSLFGMQNVDSPLPSYQNIFLDYCRASLFNDIGFYVTHRLLHHPYLYSTFHKQHHDYHGTISIAAEYANPVEVLLSNVIPSLGGILLFKAHPLILNVWLTIRLRETYQAHSGYCYQGSLMDRMGLMSTKNAIHHDHHHTSNQGNFGSLYLDWAFGTMDAFVASGGYESYSKNKK